MWNWNTIILSTDQEAIPSKIKINNNAFISENNRNSVLGMEMIYRVVGSTHSHMYTPQHTKVQVQFLYKY